MNLLTTLLTIYAVLALFFFSLMWLASKADARRRRSNPVVALRELPLAVIHIPTAWRRSRRSHR